MTTNSALFKLEIEKPILSECGDIEPQEIEVELLPPVDLTDTREVEIYNAISEIDERIAVISGNIEKLNSEIDSLTNHADGLDYTISVASGILTGLIDSFFVGELGLFDNASDEAKAKFRDAKGQSNEMVNKFIEKYAKMRGYKPQDGSNRLKGAIAYLEDKFPVAQDNTWSGEGISSTITHHLDDLAHHPTLMGLVASILVQFFRIGIFVSKDGKIHPRIVETNIKDLSCWIPVVISAILKWLSYMAEQKLDDDDNDLPEAIQWLIKNIHKMPIILQLAKVADNWFGHLVSDMAGSKNSAGGGAGIPGIFISFLKEISMLPGIKDTTFPKIINDLYASKKYTTDKIDLRTEIAVVKEQALPVVLNEVIVRTFYFIRRFVSEYKEHHSLAEMNWRNVVPFGNRTVERMMTIASGTLVAVDIADAAIRSGGFNPSCVLRINFVGIGRFAVAIGVDVGMGIKKAKKEKQRTRLTNEQLKLMNAKIYYKEAGIWISAEKAGKSILEAYEMIEPCVQYTICAWTEIYKDLDRISAALEKKREEEAMLDAFLELYSDL